MVKKNHVFWCLLLLYAIILPSLVDHLVMRFLGAYPEASSLIKDFKHSQKVPASERILHRVFVINEDFHSIIAYSEPEKS